jgi:hypothetical protein
MEPNVISKHKYLALINVLAMVTVLIALLGMSYASLMQTIQAFALWEDPTLSIGIYLPILLGVLFQYGQNAALYLRKRFGSNKQLQQGFPDWLTTNNIALSVFAVCALVDGATNILWFEKVVVTSLTSNILIYRVIGWLGMSLLVFVEEVLGWVLDGLSLSWKEYRSITVAERRMTNNQPQSSSSYKPMSHPVTRPDEDEDEDRFSTTRPVPSYVSKQFPQTTKRSDTKAHMLGKIRNDGE